MASNDNCLHYTAFGASLNLDDDYQARKLPDWRFAHFSIALPLFGLDAPGEEGSDWDGWITGRFKGLKQIQFPAQSAAGGFSRPGEKNWDCSPRIFHVTATNWFAQAMRASVGAKKIDGPVSDLAQKEPNGGYLRTAKKYLFHPDISFNQGDWDKDIPLRPGIDHPANQPSECEQRLYLASDDRRSGEKGSARERVSLSAVEYLEFEDPEQVFSAEKTCSRFLVLQITAENLSSDQLENLSSSLRRTRTKMQVNQATLDTIGWFVETLGGPRSNDRKAAKKGRINPLKYFVEVAKSVLPRGMRNAYLTPGGSFSANGEDSSLLKPIRVAVAVPARNLEDIARPALLGQGDGWSRGDQWAWMLATGADEYFRGLPRQDESGLEGCTTAHARHWATDLNQEGIGLVCTEPFATGKDTPEFANKYIWMLAPTRYVDLALLVRRSEKYLLYLSRALREMEFEDGQAQGALSVPYGAEIRTANVEAIERASRNLDQSLERFQKLQRDFLTLRDVLWFESVPGRSDGTRILAGLQEATGTMHHYKDVLDELRLRKDTYSTTYRQLELGFQRRRAEARERDAERREKEAAERDSLNLVLAFAALALAVPAIVDQLPLEGGSWWPVVISFITIVVLSFTARWWLPWLRRRLVARKSSRHLNEDQPAG